MYKGTEKTLSLLNIANVGHYTLTLPMSVRPGKGYQFEISDTRNKDEVVLSNTFSVKRRIPLVAKVVPAVIIGAGIFFLVPHNKVKRDIPDPLIP
jgi:hypothetical protein